MGFGFTSNNGIELMLKQALLKEGISFQEQYRIYQKGDYTNPRYVADFYLTHGDRSLIVECDGFSFHSSDKDIERDIARDEWLKRNGYKQIMHFTTHQIKFEMQTVILNIKNALGIEKVERRRLKFKGKRIRKSPILNLDDKSLHEVNVYYDHVVRGNEMIVSYRFADVTKNYVSEIRKRVVHNVPTKMDGDVALLTVLKDLKKSAQLTIYCQSEFLTDHFNFFASENQNEILKKIAEILHKNNYLFKHINCTRDDSYYRNIQTERIYLRELHSYCMQYFAQKSRLESQTPSMDFSDLMS